LPLHPPPLISPLLNFGGFSGKENEEMQQIKKEKRLEKNMSQDEGIRIKKEGKYLTFSLGLAKVGSGVKILLEIDKVLSGDKLDILDKAA
jgi:hypothetical protein